jgi:TolB protein
MKKYLVIILLLNISVMPLSFAGAPVKSGSQTEKHLGNIKQLTTKQGAECYFSFDDKKLIFQSARDNFKCDQMFTMNVDGTDLRHVSNGNGQTTCGHFFPNGKRIIYASTHAAGAECPPQDLPPSAAWRFSEGFDIYSAKPDGSDLKRLTSAPGYDAECTMSPDGKKIIFTSLRTGDPEIFIMDIDGSNVKQLTSELGDEGGAWFSADGKKLCLRSYYPKTDEEIKKYKDDVSKNLLGRYAHEILVMDADGSNKKQITNFGRASFAPYFHPNGKQIIFSSNLGDEPWNFELYIINVDGTGLERVTYSSGFDGFPMFSHDGKKLIFVSKRNSPKGVKANNVFIADWIQ